MSAEPESPPTARPHINVSQSGMESLEFYKREVATYLRELPRLLEEGYAWKHALVQGDDVLSVWDTRGDAVQAARERFGPDAPIFVKTIHPRDPQRFGWLKAQLGDSCPY